jgi:predicted HicB family RNase H-like nuclease
MNKERFNKYEYQKEYIKMYQKEMVENITVRVQKGQKDIIKAKAESLGMSVNAYILSLINKDLEE